MGAMTEVEALHFTAPPLTEVVLGVQFAQPASYQMVRAGEIWRLFKDRFPRVQELPAIPPMFETFGLPQGPMISFEMNLGPPRTRLWFLTESEAEIIQFQPDRLLHNWRKVADGDHPYPRFEKMIVAFEDELKTADHYFRGIDGSGLQFNQCEVTYINQILLDRACMNAPHNWLRIVSFEDTHPDDFSASFRRVLREEDGAPIGRLVCEVVSGVSITGASLLQLQITARGAPKSPSIDAAVEFLKLGRQSVGKLFLEITTENAHKEWGRVS